MTRWAWAALARRSGRVLWTVLALVPVASTAQGDRSDAAGGTFGFAIVGGVGPADTQSLLRAVDGSPVRFVVHFDLAAPSPASCADVAMDRRRDLLDTSAKPVVPVVAASSWADCGKGGGDSGERLARLGDTFFSRDESLGRNRLTWVRQSALPRFRRYPENLLWQTGGMLFATINLPENNNNFRLGAGRNGEFEERLVANRAWMERAFRIATERRLAGVVLFIDAAPRFGTPLRAPDARSSERDGFYEWKLALREFVPAFKGQVLLVQAHDSRGTGTPAPGPSVEVDHPLHDAGGRPVANFSRLIVRGNTGEARWLRVDVDPSEATLFRIAAERTFDDPSGELYGTSR